jgi:hypothetical protein
LRKLRKKKRALRTVFQYIKKLKYLEKMEKKLVSSQPQTKKKDKKEYLHPLIIKMKYLRRKTIVNK